MEEFASPALLQPPPSEAERQRVRELSRYYCAIRHPSSSGNPSPIEAPFLSPDITLNALTQLGVYRFGCTRSFVSLIDGQSQHIISEATASISLRDAEKHGPQDGIYLGVSTLDLAFGVCPDAVKLFTGQAVPRLQNTANMTADRTRFIVRDFTLEDYYKDRPYVRQWPYFRFYAEVPVYSPSGYVLGSFCVVDDKVRGEFSDDDLAALQEISDSISRHLENVRTVHYHRRSDRLVHGLTTFVKSRADYDAASATEEHCASPSPGSMPGLLTRLQSAQSQVDTTGVESISLSTVLTEETVPSTSGPTPSHATGATSVSYQSQDADPSPLSTNQYAKTTTLEDIIEDGGEIEQATHLDAPPLVAVKESVAISKRIAAIFSHASTLLAESMDLDGVLFLDAGRCNSGITHSADSTDWEPFPNTADPKFPHYPTAYPAGQSSKDTCDTLGLGFKSHETGDTQDVSQYAVPESLLRCLVASFPNGEVFDLDEDPESTHPVTLNPEGEVQPGMTSPEAGRGPVTNHNELSQEAAAARLRHQFPAAKSVAFLPLWDLDKAQWLAGTFLWTRDRERALGVEELHYFKVFGDSIVSEVARVNWSKQETSKSNFVSSMSHELRSPLHGMLASAELLSATPLQDDQRDIVKMLETCGLTLLDTMNHLLDFSKINNLVTLKAANSDFHKSSGSSLASTFGLDALLEEVVNTMYLGKLHTTTTRDIVAYPIDSQHLTNASGHKLSVVLRIEPDSEWRVRSTTGAWRRIIMNVLGNALKYTEAGFIEVSLSQRRKPTDPGQFVAHLSITDSGCGMSSEFLRNKLFSPFIQEDPLSEGVGLGLSIVQQLVSFLDGSIDFRSEPGVGSQVDIFIPVESVTTVAQPSSVALAALPAALPASTTKFCLVGVDAYSDIGEEPTGTLSSEAKRRLCIQSFFTQLVTRQPGWTVSFAETLDKASGDVAIVEESALNGEGIGSANFTRFILLSDAVSSATADEQASGAHVVRLSQPLYPQKVLDALRAISQLDGQPVTRLITPGATSEAAVPGSDTPDAGTKLLEPLLDVEKLVLESHISHMSLSRRGSVQDEGRHVLIVDDNTINVQVLSRFMRRLGWTYDVAYNGQMALEKYKECPTLFKVVLMDISMPVMDGVAATRHLRMFEREQSLAPVTIFAVTGVASSTMQQQALAAGVNGYMIKPLSLQQLGVVMKGVE